MGTDHGEKRPYVGVIAYDVVSNRFVLWLPLLSMVLSSSMFKA